MKSLPNVIGSPYHLNLQPHLMRTKLCDMKDDELDSVYVKKREQLKKLVASVIRPKIVQGKTLNGKEFVSFLEQVTYSYFSNHSELDSYQIGKLVLSSVPFY